MKASWMKDAAWSRYAWAALAGTLLAASFPKIGIAGLAWIAPGMLIFSALGRRPGEILRIGFVGGLVYALIAFYWLLLIPFPAGAISGWLALSAYLALFTAVWVWICCRIRNWVPAPLWAITCGVVWVALEMILARLFTGFPWNLLGVSQYQILPLLQVTAVTGVYGISFLIVWFSVALGLAVLRLCANPARSRAWIQDLILPLAALMAVVAFGVHRLAQAHPPARTLRAVLIQPSIPQTLIWDTNQNTARFNQLVELSERALRQVTNAQVLIWPEAAVPNMLRYERETYQAVTNLVVSHHVWMILGSDDAVARRDHEGEYDFFNSSFLVDPLGGLVDVYRKRGLVIFGEYIPLERWLPFMKYLTPVGGSFTAGRGPVPFFMPDVQTKTSVLICFEDIFPHLGRQYVEEDTDFLLNLTNNGWFGESAAQWQHAANAVLRTVENHIPLVRCANNGLTCWVDAYGGMHQVYFSDSKDVYKAGFKTVDVPLLAPGQKRALTFYTRHGDVFGWSCVGITALLLLCIGRAGWLQRRPIPGSSLEERSARELGTTTGTP